MKYTQEDLQDALDLAKPGRILELDSDGNMSKNCVAAVIHNLCALAEYYDLAKSQEARWYAELEGVKDQNAALRAELAAAQEELESIQPDTDEHRTIADSIAGHREWASATEKCERMCLEKAEKAESELASEKAKREAAERAVDANMDECNRLAGLLNLSEKALKIATNELDVLRQINLRYEELREAIRGIKV